MTKGGITHIFFDNWNGVFSGERGANSPNLEKYVAALFAMAPEGTIMTTVSPLRSALGCLPLGEANKQRERKNLPVSDNASYYDVEEFELGPLCDVYSFSEGGTNQEMIMLYRYVRTKQSANKKASRNKDESQVVGPCFLCNNPKCEKAQEGTPIGALKYEDSPMYKDKTAVIGGCTCNVSDRVMRRRKK